MLPHKTFGDILNTVARKAALKIWVRGQRPFFLRPIFVGEDYLSGTLMLNPNQNMQIIPFHSIDHLEVHENV